ncbi:MAG TPA: bifunctional 5,10-methylenetetrahydrofolate dehydrogenase/5,10-methenyltetrahydrofolate cyclohydrolase [Candidatus Omnitrophota bacterium]|nr:bifunctional 5,10-methylenetetrahydrofolate dehydrogenase/5,10-methenyltetrahydrofolate cyclohydrolase [Candidatus Omnitrophota bacterium]HRZ14958.1 bifunctional 5,10-methylenetetrahydrofolate dehydrogenase/5,10-methenyltetrahydrofolate cyclohydrolase [Candidatus Omnitrophota bacterium]
MSAKLLEGKLIADQLREILKQKIQAAHARLRLASIQVGTNPATEVYIKSQKRIADLLGIDYQLHALPKETSQEAFCAFAAGLNRDAGVQGIIVQLPLPLHLSYTEVIQCIVPEKDIEGMHPINLGRVVFGKARILPCTAAAAMELLQSIGMGLSGKEVVIIGHSEIVGKPLALMLMDKLATVTVCHIGTYKAGKLEEHVRRADILIVAVGKPGLIKGEWIKEKAVIIDIGINKIGDKIVGDVEFEEAQKHAAWITPVPGGVGPLTVMMLMRNLVEAAHL